MSSVPVSHGGSRSENGSSGRSKRNLEGIGVEQASQRSRLNNPDTGDKCSPLERPCGNYSDATQSEFLLPCDSLLSVGQTDEGLFDAVGDGLMSLLLPEGFSGSKEGSVSICNGVDDVLGEGGLAAAFEKGTDACGSAQDTTGGAVTSSCSSLTSDASRANHSLVPSESLVASASSDPAATRVRVQNVIASGRIEVEGRPNASLDLRRIAISCRLAEYNPRKINACIVRLRKPKCTGLIFRSGMSISQPMFLSRSRRLNFPALLVVSYVVSGTVLMQCLGREVLPRLRRAGWVFVLQKLTASVVFFRAGRVMVTGAESESAAHRAARILLKIIRAVLGEPPCQSTQGDNQQEIGPECLSLTTAAAGEAPLASEDCVHQTQGQAAPDSETPSIQRVSGEESSEPTRAPDEDSLGILESLASQETSLTPPSGSETSNSKALERRCNVLRGIKLSSFAIENVVATADCGLPVRLEGLAFDHKEFCSYEPELFAGTVA